jgi:hypothetical protein
MDHSIAAGSNRRRLALHRASAVVVRPAIVGGHVLQCEIDAIPPIQEFKFESPWYEPRTTTRTA